MVFCSPVYSMEWSYQLAVASPRFPAASVMEKVGAPNALVATQVHLSELVKPLAARRVTVIAAVDVLVNVLTTALFAPPHVAAICGQAARASSILGF